MSGVDRLLPLVREFLSVCPPGFDFPNGGKTELPLSQESQLARQIQEGVSADSLANVRRSLSILEAYNVVIFGVRTAILAVRRREPRLLRVALTATVCDDALVDWRDILRALAIIEDCAMRLNVDFGSEVKQVARVATERRRHTLLEGYLSRPAAMRTIDVMGIRASGSSENLDYCSSSESGSM